MKSQNISVEEAMKITHKSREFIIQAIENGSFPGSFTKTKNGTRCVHIPRNAFNEYMNHFYRAPSDALISALVEELTKTKTIE